MVPIVIQRLTLFGLVFWTIDIKSRKWYYNYAGGDGCPRREGVRLMFRVGEVHFNRVAPSGNIFAILGGASRILRRCGRNPECEEMVERVTSSGSYEEALAIINEYVNLIEDEEEGDWF